MRLFLLIMIIFLAISSCYASASESQNNIANDKMNGKVVEIKKGTTMPILLQTPIDTSKVKENDVITASLDEDLDIDGATVAKRGSIISGKIVKARNGSSWMRGGKIKMTFDKIVTTEKQTYAISTKPVEFVITEENRWSFIGYTVLAVVAIALYTVATGGAGIVIAAAAVIGGAGCGIVKLSEKGPDALIPEETAVDISLNAPLSAVATYSL